MHKVPQVNSVDSLKVDLVVLSNSLKPRLFLEALNLEVEEASLEELKQVRVHPKVLEDCLEANRLQASLSLRINLKVEACLEHHHQEEFLDRAILNNRQLPGSEE